MLEVPADVHAKREPIISHLLLPGDRGWASARFFGGRADDTEDKAAARVVDSNARRIMVARRLVAQRHRGRVRPNARFCGYAPIFKVVPATPLVDRLPRKLR